MALDWKTGEAPKDGTQVLAWTGNGYLVAWYETGRSWGKDSPPLNEWTTGWETQGGYDVGYNVVSEPTLWIPLPRDPQKGMDDIRTYIDGLKVYITAKK